MRLCATLLLASVLGGAAGLRAQEVVRSAAPCPREPVVQADSGRGALYLACQVAVRAQLAEPTLPQFPEILRSAWVEGTARVEFIVMPEGRVDSRSIRPLASSHELFAFAVRRYLARTVWRPAQREGSAVRQVVEVEYVFRLRSSTEASCAPNSVGTGQVLVCVPRYPTVRCSSHAGCDTIP